MNDQSRYNVGGATMQAGAGRAGGVRGLVMRRIERHFRFGSLEVRWPDGVVSSLSGTLPGPHATVELHKWRAIRRLIFGGSLGFAEAYMAGEWDSPDLAAAVELAALHRLASETTPRAHFLSRIANGIRHRRNENTRLGSRRNIAYHYDLGNEFYKLWLDPSLTYSSAIYETPSQPLAAAQTNKCRRLLSLLDPKPGQSLLEIGCGWGNFASLAAREFGLSVTAITLSQEQYKFTRERIQREGLGEKVTVRLTDYRDVAEQFDHVASVEMFEAVGEQYWQTFFDKVRDVLKPDGRAALQIITIDDRLFDSYRRGVDFIQRYIFPGGMLPSTTVLMDRVRQAGLKWRADDGFGQHYARTLAEWRRRFNHVWPKVAALDFDERFRRMWDLYLAYCEGGFRAGNIDVRQIALSRSG